MKTRFCSFASIAILIIIVVTASSGCDLLNSATTVTNTVNNTVVSAATNTVTSTINNIVTSTVNSTVTSISTTTVIQKTTEIPVLGVVAVNNLTPASPAALKFNQDVVISFNYVANEPGVLIFARPMTRGDLTPNYAASGSLNYAQGKGSGTASFTITSGNAVLVDQIRFQMYKSDNKTLIAEVFMAVNYSFSPNIG